MGKMSSEKVLDLLYNKKLPQVYRDEDSKLGFPLKRYLESLIVGGYCGNIEDIEGILTLIDPTTIPEKFLPYLYESFGLVYLPDVDPTYQRKFLANVGELVRRRGTFSSVHYMTRVLTGLDSELSYYEGYHDGIDGNYLFIVLLAKTVEQIQNIGVSIEVIRNFIGSQIPYYIGPVITSRLDNQIVRSNYHSHSALGCYKFYTIQQYKEVTN